MGDNSQELDPRALMERIFPIARSITGDGLRETLAVLGEHVDIDVYEVPSGTAVLDWTVPPEWNIRQAWIKGPDGTFISARPSVALPAEPDVAEGLRDLVSGNPDPRLLPPVPIDAALAEPTVLYGHDSVDPVLRLVAATAFQSDHVPAEHIAVVSGALDGLERTLGAHVRTGDRVAVEDPSYSSVIDLLGALGLIPVPVPIDDEGIRRESLSAAVASGVSAVVLTPRAHNPFGSALTRSRADALRDVLGAHPEILIVEDDHAGAVAGMPFVTSIGPETERWAVLRSAAKTYGPDFRIALMAGDATTIRRVTGRQALGPGWVSHMLQGMLVALMSDPAADSQVELAAQTYAARRRALVDALGGLGIKSHGISGLNVWIPVVDEQVAVSGMRDLGFAVRAGGSGFDPPQVSGSRRLPFLWRMSMMWPRPWRALSDPKGVPERRSRL